MVIPNFLMRNMMSSAKNYRLTERDLKVPELLKDYRILTTSQIQRLLYPSLQKTSTRLLRLYKNKIVKRFPYPVLMSEGGKGEFIYHIKRKPKISLMAVQHTIHLNDIRIDFELACRKLDHIDLVAFIAEYKGMVNKEGWPRRVVEDGVNDIDNFDRKVSIIPDAVICLENKQTKKRALFMLELDMGSQKLQSGDPGCYSVLKKLMLYKQYLDSQGFERYNEMFKYQFRGFRVLTVMNNPRRIQITRRELTNNGIHRFIWFTEMNRINTNTLFEKIWMRTNVGDDNRYSILGD
ncbi:replication-relaxation family protein [Caldithrix abyssi]|nr:replication-relaxation family protein [Caldithrix abyssi]